MCKKYFSVCISDRIKLSDDMNAYFISIYYSINTHTGISMFYFCDQTISQISCKHSVYQVFKI